MSRVSFPSKVMIQTTSLCNSHCIMCPYETTSTIQSQGNMEWKLFKKIINECKEHKIERILLYLMNEPLMDKNIVKKINYAKKKNPNSIVHIVSNGNLLNKRLSRKILKSKLDYIEFSVHGIDETNYENIMNKLKFKKTIKGIKEFIELAKKYKKNENYINIKSLNIKKFSNKKEKVVTFWNNLGIKKINYFEAPISRAGNVKWLKIKPKTKLKGCNSIWRNEMIHILYNGDVILCCMDWKRKNVLGNLNNKTINEIWNNNKYQLIEKKINGKVKSSDDFICKQCEASI